MSTLAVLAIRIADKENSTKIDQKETSEKSYYVVSYKRKLILGDVFLLNVGFF